MGDMGILIHFLISLTLQQKCAHAGKILIREGLKGPEMKGL